MVGLPGRYSWITIRVLHWDRCASAWTGYGCILGLMGMLIGTIIVQQFGWYQSVKKRVNYMQILGIIIMVVGVALIQLV